MSTKVARLVEHALQSARAGRLDEAENYWTAVLDRDPQHTQALSSLGTLALERGDLTEALERLEVARLTAPTDLFVLMALAEVRREAGDSDGELEAVQWALAVDTEYVPALLQKGSWYERHGDAVSACAAYSNALANSPPEPQWPGQYRASLADATAFIEQHRQKLNEYLQKELAACIEAMDGSGAGRWREAASIAAGKSSPYVSISRQLHVPRLPAVPFFDSASFPELDSVTKSVSVIREELLAVLENRRERFQPYIVIPPGEPVDQWQALNHSTRWTALHFWEDGEARPDNLELCPRTAEVFGSIELCDLGGVGPQVFVSVLAGNTQIPPHNGETNARVKAHLPLIASPQCKLRVGFEERQWRESEFLIFDDTIENEAWNDSDEPCVVLVFDLWNPLLSDADRRTANELARAGRNFPG